MHRRLVTSLMQAAVAAALLAACGDVPPDHAPGYTPAGAAACAERIFWGRVLGTSSGASGLRVDFAVEEWLKPSTGPTRTTVQADDPRQEVGAPSWQTSEPVLVIEPNGGPPDYLQKSAAHEMDAAARRPLQACTKDTP